MLFIECIFCEAGLGQIEVEILKETDKKILVKAILRIVAFLLQLFWTPDVIIHDLVNFNKPEILNEVGALGRTFIHLQIKHF